MSILKIDYVDGLFLLSRPRRCDFCLRTARRV